MATPQYMSAADYAKLPSSIAKEKDAMTYQANNPNTSSSKPQAWDRNSAAYNPAAWIPGASAGAGGQMTYAPIAGTQTAQGANPNASTTAAIFDGSNGSVKGYRKADGTLVWGDGDATERAAIQQLIGGGMAYKPPVVAPAAPSYTVGNGSTTPMYNPAHPTSQGASYTPNVGIPSAAKPAGYQIGNGVTQEPYKPSYNAYAPISAVSSQTMNPATGQGYAMPQLSGGTGNLPGQYSGVFAQNAPASYTAPTPTTGTPPMDAAAIQKYAADQIAAKLAAATNSANQARTSAEGDATQSTGLLDNQLAQAIARLKASAEQAQSGVKTGFERANDLTKDNRTLSDASFQRNTNPFSGATDYKSALIGREREITDRQGLEDYNSRLGSINQDAMNQQGAVEQDISASKAGIQQGLNNLKNKITTDLQNLETSTGAEKERLIREITNDERQYAMALRGEDRADVMQNATLAQQKFQQELDTFKTNYNVGTDQRDYAYKVGRDVKTDFAAENALNYAKEQDKIKNEQSANVVARQTKVDNWNAYMDSVGLTGNLGTGAKADWSLLGSTEGAQTEASKTKYLQEEGAKLNNDMAKLQLADYPQEQKLKMQQLQKQIDQIGKAPYQSAQDLEYDKIKLDTAKEQLKQLTTGKSIPDDDVAKMIESSPLFQKQYDDDGKLLNSTVPEANKQQLAQYIASLGLPADQAKKWFVRYGLWSGNSGN